MIDKRMKEQYQNYSGEECYFFGLSLFSAYDKTGEEKYRKDIEEMMFAFRQSKKETAEADRWLPLLPLFVMYENRFGTKEGYPEAAALFQKGKELLSQPVYLMCLADTLACIDENIYDCYDQLRSLFKDAVAQILREGGPASKDPVFGAVIQKGCRLRVLLSHKYQKWGEWIERGCEKEEEYDFF